MGNKKINLEKLGFQNVSKDDKKVFLTLSANYGNIGDIAITIAQEKIIRDVFPDRKIVEIPMDNAIDYEDDIKNILNENDVATTIGGGNLGNVYLWHEQRRRAMIDLFKNNVTVSFPQSIDFKDTDEGKKEFKTSINTYAQNSKLSIMAREKRSYDIMKDNFKNNVHLVPDTVFYLKNKLNMENWNIPRECITLCLRNDREKVTNTHISDNLINLLSQNGYSNISLTDTHLGEIHIQPEERHNIFETSLREFKSAKVVITDRLHGMIFCAITDTPCIALDNSNKKISATYNTWLKDIPTIKFLDGYDEEKILNSIAELYNLEDPKVEFDFNNEFKPLFSAFDI